MESVCPLTKPELEGESAIFAGVFASATPEFDTGEYASMFAGCPFALDVEAHANSRLNIVVPVFWPNWNAISPLVPNEGLEHKYPGEATHADPTRDPPPKTPRENNAPNTTAIISIAQPYVMRYSMALCALVVFLPNIISPNSRILLKKQYI
jgi:hypothetical protein